MVRVQDKAESGSFRGVSMHSINELSIISMIMKISNHFDCQIVFFEVIILPLITDIFEDS